jgi:hypothetical protein
MSRRLARPALPAELGEFLDGQRLLAKSNDVIELLTVSEEGWPHVALLSVGEVLAASDTELRLALWPESQTTANLRRTSRATLTCVHAGTGFYVELEAEALPGLVQELACFRCSVRGVLVDRADYADLTGGMTFSLKDPATVLPRWSSVVAELRRLE